MEGFTMKLFGSKPEFVFLISIVIGLIASYASASEDIQGQNYQNLVSDMHDVSQGKKKYEK
jgi:hypothetical protein